MSRAVKMVAATVVLAVLGAANPALAVDSPKWVAAIYVEAQKMIGLRWIPVAGATGYKVLRSTQSGSGFEEIASVPAPQHLDKDLEVGTTYYYVLQALAGGETSANSDEKSVVIPGEAKKKVVLAPVWKNITAQQVTEFGKTSFKVGVFWEKNKSPDVVAYNIYRSTATGKDYQLIGSTPEVQYIDATVEADKTYFYVLTATDTSFQETPFSEEKSVELKVAKKVVSKVKKEEKNDVIIKKTKFVMEVPLPDAETAPLSGVADFVYHEDSELMYVVDNLAPKIVMFNEDGVRVGDFGVRGFMEGQFSTPVGIAVDNDDNIVVADLGRRAIITFTPKGDFVREFKTDKKFKPEDEKEPLPVAVAVNKDGEYIVTDNVNSHLLRYSEDGALLGGWGAPASKKEQTLGFMSAPGGIDIDDQGRIFLQDYGLTRIQVFDAAGEGLFTLGENVKGLVGSFVKVGKPFVDDKAKVIYALDNAMGNIQGFDYETGKYIHTLTNANGDLKFNERADWNLTSTRAMQRDSQGRYWVMMGLDRKFGVIDPLE